MKDTHSRSSLYTLPLAITLGLSLSVAQLAAPVWAITPQARDAYQQAVQAERLGHLSDAERFLRQAIALDPQDYLNYVKLASILNQQDKPNEAASYYQHALNLQPEDGMILYSLGGVYEQLGQYAKAEEAYALSLQNNPRYQYALLNLARAEIQQKKYTPAIAHYQQFLSQYPDHYEARRRLAKLYLVTGQETASVKEYDALKQRFPNRFDEHLDMARALNGANAPAQALEELKLAYAKEGGKADIDEEMGRAHVALGQADLAILNYQKAYALDPTRDDLLLKMAELYRFQKNPDQAIVQYLAFLKLHPENQDVRRQLVNVYFENQRFEPALNELGVMLAAASEPKTESPDALKNNAQQQYDIRKDMAYATQMLGDLPKATGQYEALLQSPLAANDLQLKSNLAIAYHKSGAYAKAIPLYKQIYYAEPQDKQQYRIDTVGLGNDLAVAITAVGDAAYKSEDYNAALTAFGDATLYAASTNYWPQLGLANTYYALNMPEKAYAAYGTVLEKDPDNVTARLYRTKLSIAKGASDPTKPAAEAAAVMPAELATLEALAKENPTNLEVLAALADAYAQQGNATAAASAYEKALAVAPQNVPLLLSLGTQWQKLGNYEQAKAVYLRALAIDDHSPMLYYNLGIVCNELGQLDQSAQAYQKALALDPHYVDSQYGLAITLEKQQKYQDALETYQTYARDPQAHYGKEAQSRIEILKQALNPAPVISPDASAVPGVPASVPVKPAVHGAPATSSNEKPSTPPKAIPKEAPKSSSMGLKPAAPVVPAVSEPKAVSKPSGLQSIKPQVPAPSGSKSLHVPSPSSATPKLPTVKNGRIPIQ